MTVITYIVQKKKKKLMHVLIKGKVLTLYIAKGKRIAIASTLTSKEKVSVCFCAFLHWIVISISFGPSFFVVLFEFQLHTSCRYKSQLNTLYAKMWP